LDTLTAVTLPRPTDLRALIEPRFDEFVESLQEMVNIDCGSFTPDGVNRIADLCEKRLSGAGFDTHRRRHRPAEGESQLGDVVVGSAKGAGGPRFLLIGHMDTVFSEGTAAERPFRVEGDTAFGPGVIDMKSGLLAGLFALEALRETGFERFGRISYVCNPDEEIGSPLSKPVIQELARESDVALVLEGGRENGNIVSARKGVADVRIDIAGRAAHAGVNPGRGRSAVVEAAHKVLALHGLNGRWPGVSVNAGVIEGGSRANVVPERCRVHVDVRSPEDGTFDQALAEVIRIAERSTVPDVAGTAQIQEAHRPFERTEASAPLVTMAKGVAHELGFEIDEQSTGGASDGNTTAAEGVPTLDGLGPVGGDPHGPDEWLDLASVVPRVSMFAGLLVRICAELG
jgi:glutamate carboxypeptidase